MPWPAWYRTAEPSQGTCYIPSYDFPREIEKCGRTGQAWRYQNRFTTYCPSRRRSFKAIDRLQPESEANFWEIMGAAKNAGLNPPTSYSDLFLSCYRSPMPRVSPRSPFYGFRFGGWQQTFRSGASPQTVYQYDLNKAYRWAASSGLPDLRTAITTWDWDAPNSVYLVSGVPPGAIPYHRTPGSFLHLVTSEERDALGLRNARGITIHRGVRFSKMVDLTEAFAKVDSQFSPAIVRRMCHSFWGLWNTTTAPEVLSWKHGEKVRQMRNPWYNPIWSAFITSRVKLRLNIYRGRMLHCFVDSVHVTDPIETGAGVGEWKHVGTYKNFWVRAPGQWGDGDYTLKYTGRGSIILGPLPLRK